MNLGIIYKATNRLNGKCYIGQTYQKFEKRKNRHLYVAFNKHSNSYTCHFHNAIRKYKEDVWQWEIIKDNIPIERLNEEEALFVWFFNAFVLGYNCNTGGGNGRIVGKETRKKISEAGKGKHHTDETKRKIGEAGKGRKYTKNSKRKMSEAQQGKPKSEETKRKISETLKGKPLTEETKRKISEALKGKLWSENRRNAQNNRKGI